MTDYQKMRKMFATVIDPKQNPYFYGEITDKTICIIGENEQEMHFEFDDDGKLIWWR